MTSPTSQRSDLRFVTAISEGRGDDCACGDVDCWHDCRSCGTSDLCENDDCGCACRLCSGFEPGHDVKPAAGVCECGSRHVVTLAGVPVCSRCRKAVGVAR